MATDHDPSALDASAQTPPPVPAGGVPRHASAKERRARGLGPFLSDLKAEVQNQLARAEVPGRVPGSGAVGPDRTPEPLPQALPETLPEPFGRQAEDAAALATAALATADHAGSEAVTARQEADAARADAAAARSEAASARATAERADAQLSVLRAEIEAAHREFGALRDRLDDAEERTRRHVLIAWAGAGAGLLVAVVALVLGF
ncbi:hypothetical protein [Promicromonospora sukumoe]